MGTDYRRVREKESSSVHSKTRHKPQQEQAFTGERDPHIKDHTRLYTGMSSRFRTLEMTAIFSINTVIMWLQCNKAPHSNIECF